MVGTDVLPVHQHRVALVLTHDGIGERHGLDRDEISDPHRQALIVLDQFAEQSRDVERVGTPELQLDTLLFPCNQHCPGYVQSQ